MELARPRARSELQVRAIEGYGSRAAAHGDGRLSDENNTTARATNVVPLDPKSVPAVPDIPRITLSHKRVGRADWRNKSFADLNALGAEFEDCDFRYSIFQRGYFRDLKFTNCRFDGAKFNDCNFKRATFYACDLKFVQFQRCLLDLDEVIASLPAEPNIRREVLQNLRANAVEVGDYASQARLVLEEVAAAKRHYSYALWGYDSYYKRKYLGVFPKIRAGAKLAGLNTSGLIWGHGEKAGRLIISCFVLLGVLAFINFWNVMPRVGWKESGAGWNVFEYVVQLFLDMSIDPKFRGFAVIDYAAVVMRYVYIGLFISILYKSISHR